MKKYQQEHATFEDGLAVIGAAALGMTLTACGGGDGGDGSGAGGFTEPADALLHATLVPSFTMDANDSPPPLGSCPDSGSQSVESTTVDSPYAVGGTLSAIRVNYDDCTDGDLRLDGQKDFGSETSGVGARHVRLGVDGGDPFTKENAAGVTTYQGASDFCDLGCAAINGVPAREMQSDLGLDVEETGGGGLTFIRGTDSQPLLQRWREDHPSAGQITFWLDGFVSYEEKGECRVAAQYSVPDESRAPVLAAGGGGTARVFESGLLRMERDGTVAEAVYDAAGVTITVDGVGNSYTWVQVFSAWADRCNISP